MSGPEDTPYEGGYFPCVMEFPTSYPNSPPVMRFVVSISHNLIIVLY